MKLMMCVAAMGFAVRRLGRDALRRVRRHRPHRIPRWQTTPHLRAHARARQRHLARHRLLAFHQLEQTPQPQLRELPQDARLPLPEKRGRALRQVWRMR